MLSVRQLFWEPAMWVVKLGGSLHDAPALGRWLHHLATAPGPPRIVVPGGGPFADTVRESQPKLGFDDLVAHRMAILAMQQFGIALQALEPALGVAETDDELRAAAASVWLPWQLAGGAAVEASWNVTSDSLACWLATRLAAPTLILVKSAPVPSGTYPALKLVAAGLLDTAFPGFAGAYSGIIHVIHRDTPLAGSLDQLTAACRVLA
jgi:aspartokinase-like uncharacterized kinase